MPGGEVCWTSDPSVNPELPQLVMLSVAASAAQSDEPGERVLLPGDGPVYLFWLRDDNHELICILAISWRSGDFEQRTFAFVHSLVKPAHRSACVANCVARVQLLRMNNTMSERDRDLDALLLAGGDAEPREASGDEIKNLLQNATTHLQCEFSALVVPERSLVVIAQGRRPQRRHLGRWRKVHRHLLSLAQVRSEPVVLNAANSPARRDADLSRAVEPGAQSGRPRRRRAGAVPRAAMPRNSASATRSWPTCWRAAPPRIIESSYDSLSGLLTRSAFEQRARALMGERADERKNAVERRCTSTPTACTSSTTTSACMSATSCIAKLGELIRSRLVPGALAARISGDRFAILLPTGPEEAVAFAEALRAGRGQRQRGAPGCGRRQQLLRFGQHRRVGHRRSARGIRACLRRGRNRLQGRQGSRPQPRRALPGQRRLASCAATRT